MFFFLARVAMNETNEQLSVIPRNERIKIALTSQQTSHELMYLSKFSAPTIAFLAF